MNTYQLFREFESTYDLEKFMVYDIWYYPILKIIIFFTPINKDSNANKDRKEKNKFDILKDIYKSIKWASRNRRKKKVDILFVDSAVTRRVDNDAVYSNIFFDPLIKTINKYKFLLFEFPSENFGHHINIPYSDIYFPDFQIQKILLKAKFKKKKHPLNYSAIKDLFSHFNLIPNIEDINAKITKFLLYHAFYLQYLQKISPKILIIIYPHTHTKMALMYAAKKLGIPTIELQHGIIYESHMAYIYHKAINRDLFPDYLFTFGHYFSKLMHEKSVMLEDSKLYSIGYPYLENIKKSHPIIPDSVIKAAKDYKIIYITSQGIVRDLVSKFVLELDRLLEKKYVIIYKPHPSEIEIENYYQSFKDTKRIILIKDKKISSIELMKVSYVHSTVVSTSFFEASYLGLPNIFINFKKYTQYISEFIDNDTNFLAHNPPEFVDSLKIISKKYDYIKRKTEKTASNYYRNNSLYNMKNKIEFLLGESCDKTV